MINIADPRLAGDIAGGYGGYGGNNNNNSIPEAQFGAARLERDADLLHEAMKGFGTRDNELIVRWVSPYILHHEAFWD